MSDVERPDTIGAHRRAETIRNGLRSYVETKAALVDAYEKNDWMTLGYTSWQAYCDKEFNLKSLRLSAEDRLDAAMAFQDAGMTLREIAAGTGSSPATIHRALNPKPPVSDETKPPLVTALIGAIKGVEENQKKAAAGVTHAPAAEASSSSTSSGASAAVPAPVDGGDGAAVTPADSPADRDPESIAFTGDAAVATTGQPEEDHREGKPGDEDDADARPSSDAQPQAGVVSNDVGSDETGLQDAAPRLSSGPVDGRQQAGTGVSLPAVAPEHSGGSEEQGQAAASVPALPQDLGEEQDEPLDELDVATDPVAALEGLATVFERIDVDVLGPLLTSDEMERLSEALIGVTNVVELLTLWYERTQA